jgi:dipeptidyl aminopeptidase/acylaminoacyl peptidase
MKKISFIIVSLLSGICILNLTAKETFRKYEINDIGKIYTLTNPQISPDGKTIMLVVSKPDFDENRNINEVYLVDISTGHSRKFISGQPSVRHPRWSPTGREIAFIAPDKSGSYPVSQIYSKPVYDGEAVKLTDSPAGVQQFAWSRDGNMIAYVSEDEPENKKEIEKGYDAFDIIYHGIFLPFKPKFSHIWLISKNGDECKKLTSGEWSVDYSPLSWSPDGKKIAFQRNELPYSGKFMSFIYTIEIETGRIERITKRENDDDSMIFETSPSYSPDGKYISYRFPRNGIINGSEVYLTTSNGGDGTSITWDLDRCFYYSDWTSDSQSILVAANDFNSVSLWKTGIHGKAEKMNLGNLCITGEYGFHVSTGPGGSVAFIASSSNSPQELYSLSPGDTAARKLTEFNKEVAGMKLGRQETISWTSDSFTPNGILTFPPDFDETRKYPLVIRIHPGPDNSSKEYFNTEAQHTASNGYIVFEPNYRGSDNMGSDFLMAVKENLGEGPGLDIMRGIEELKKRSYIDENKIAVSGWSFGGFMTTWLIGNYQGWTCAVAGAAITDLTDQYSLSDIGYAFKYHMGHGKSPFSDNPTKEEWIKQSPITYVENVKTPTLLISCSYDERVPVSQSFKYFRALKDIGTESRLVVIPTAGHHPADPVRNRERYRIWLDWLDKYLTESN